MRKRGFARTGWATDDDQRRPRLRMGWHCSKLVRVEPGAQLLFNSPFSRSRQKFVEQNWSTSAIRREYIGATRTEVRTLADAQQVVRLTRANYVERIHEACD